MKIMSNPSIMNLYSVNGQNKDNRFAGSNYSVNNSVNFGCAKPKSKLFKPFSDFYEHSTEKIARGMAKLLETKPVEKLVVKAKKSKRLVAHLAAFTSLVLSGFYVKQTLQNEDLEKSKRNTLAINQAATSILSTILAYAADTSIHSKVNEVINKYLAVNVKTASPKMLNKFKAGFNAAKTIVIFGTIHRFIAPVFVTPIANHIGNKVNAKKHSSDETKKA